MIRPVLRHTLLAAGILLGSHAALAENRVALVIGQSNYRAVVPLPNPANDAKAVSQMLTESGFEVLTASDLSQNELRAKVGDFAAKMAEKGPDTVALVFYAGHGLQIDGENFLVPVDVDPKRETDIPLQAVRLNYFFTPRVFVQSLVQYSNQAQVFSANVRFGWLSTAGTGLFVVLNDAEDGPGVFDWTKPLTRSFVVKFSKQFGTGG